MADLGLLAIEVRNLRVELEGLKRAVQERSFLPSFYKRTVIALMVFCAVTAVIAGYNAWCTQRIYSIMSDWELYENGNVAE